MDISLKCLGFTLLMIKYLCVSLTLKQPGWARFEGNAPSHPSKHYSKLTHIGEYYFALSCITPPYLHHPSPVYYRGWPHISVVFRSHRKLKLEEFQLSSVCQVVLLNPALEDFYFVENTLL